jgi:type IV secretion system protein VirD4
MASPAWNTNEIYLGFEINDPLDVTDIPEHSILDEPWTRTGDLHDYGGEGHIITFGPSGSGKTRRLLLPNLNRLPGWSVVVVDPKGSLAVQTAAHRKAQGSHIITLDPFGVIDQQYPGLTSRLPFLKSAGLNPLAALDPASSDFPDDAKTLAEALIKIDGTNEVYFPSAARDLVAGLIMAARVEDGPKANLGDIRANIGLSPLALGVLLKKKKPEGSPGYLDLYGKQYPEMAAKLNRFADIAPENKDLTSVLGTAQSQTGWLDSRPLKADLSTGAHDFAALKKRPTTVYLILPPRYLESHATWLRLMVTAILMPLIRTIGGRVPVLFMLDEFAQLGRMEVIERNMALTREYGVKLWPILQDLAQLKGLYKDRWESFISNAGIRHAFAAQDVSTLEYFSKLSGQRDYWFQSAGTNVGTSQGPQTSQSTGQTSTWGKTQGPQVWEIGLSKLEQGQAVLFNRGDVFRSWLPDPEPRDARAPNLLPETKAMLERARATANGAATLPPPRVKLTATATGLKVTCICPHCQGKARVPGDRRIKVTCPHCKREFMFEPSSRSRTAENSSSGVVNNILKTVRKWL